jgi:hypothetical protein
MNIRQSHLAAFRAAGVSSGAMDLDRMAEPPNCRLLVYTKGRVFHTGTHHGSLLPTIRFAITPHA